MKGIGRALAAAAPPALGLALAALLLSRPGLAALGALQAMARWQASVVPALFPFLALMPLLTGEAAVRAWRKLLGRTTEALFGLPGDAAPALVVGMLAGSPAGTLAARRIAARSGLNRGQLQRIAASVAGLSPGFLVSGLGAGLLGSAAAGRVLLRSQLLGQLALLLATRRAWRDRRGPVAPPPRTGEETPLSGAVLAILTVGGWMILCGALAFALRPLAGRRAADALLCLIDLPAGAALIAALPWSLALRTLLLSALCGFGGVCVCLQNLSALRGSGVRPGAFLALRLLAAALSAAFTWAQLRLGMAGGGIPLPSARPLCAAAMTAALLASPAVFLLWTGSAPRRSSKGPFQELYEK